jgi:hypothetical protein
MAKHIGKRGQDPQEYFEGDVDAWRRSRKSHHTPGSPSFTRKETEELLMKIASRLTGILEEDLTAAESQILCLLMDAGILAIDGHDTVRMKSKKGGKR